MQATLFLAKFSTDMLHSYFQRWFHAPVSLKQAAPLGAAGNYMLSHEDIASHTDYTRPKTVVYPPPHVPVVYNALLLGMATDLLHMGYAQVTTAPATGSFFVMAKNNSPKPRFIFNGQYANMAHPFHPTHFSLLSFDDLKLLLRSCKPLYMHRTDIQNFYWLIVLPVELSSSFVATIIGQDLVPFNIALLCAPFGWDFIPTISNTIVHAIIDYLQAPDLHLFNYVDDNLLVSSVSPEHANNNVNLLRSSLKDNKFIIHLPGSPKSSLLPTTQAPFVGKDIISGASPSIHNNNTTNQTTLFYALVVSSMLLSPKHLQSIIGTFQWASVHNNFAKPFLYALHRLAMLPHHRRIRLHKGGRHALINAAVLSALPWTPCDISFAFPPSSYHLVFADASHLHANASAVVLLHNLPFFISWSIPAKYNSSQQSAELYAFYRAFAFSQRVLGPTAIVSDSQSTIYSILSLNAGPKNPSRAHLLQKIARLVSKLKAPSFVLWTRSENNPADYPSRNLPVTPHLTPIPTTVSLPPLDISNCLSSFY